MEWCDFIVSFLESQKIKYACISPGARNSALTYTLINNKNIKCFSNIDERSSGFFALGIAKASKQPVVIVCTSGTAVSNFFPAVIEASLSFVPILVLSADRPKKMIGTGANQTIDQNQIFGKYVRFFKDIGLPKKEFSKLEKKLKEAISHLKGIHFNNPPGPVHINVPFEEPLLSKNKILHQHSSFNIIKDNPIKKNIYEVLSSVKKPLFIAGPNSDNGIQNNLILLAEKMNAPILADPLSQIRYGYDSDNIISHYDIFIKKINFNPDLILRIGSKPTSKKLCSLLDRWKKKTILLGSYCKFNDDCPKYIQTSINNFLEFQINNIDWFGDFDWLNKFISSDKKIEKYISLEQNEHEGMIARACQYSLNHGDTFFIGNSMPIRDVDAFTMSRKIKIHTYANRGASGIDGVLSTALGVSYYNKKNSLLLIGDLSFFHDSNGLLASKHGINLTIVVINNGGGGIFSFLPIADINKNKFKNFWITDTGLDVKNVAKLYNCKYERVVKIADLKKSIKSSFNYKGVKIIEIKTIISENVQSHNSLLNNIYKKL